MNAIAFPFSILFDPFQLNSVISYLHFIWNSHNFLFHSIPFLFIIAEDEVSYPSSYVDDVMQSAQK